MSRVGNFSSSEIWKLIDPGTREMTDDEKFEWKKIYPKSQKKLTEDWDTFSQAGLTYIKQKQWERRIGRSLTNQVDSPETLWGHICEPVAFDNIPGFEWELVSKDRLSHPELPWTGAPDLIAPGKVGDIKCPHTLTSFCQKADLWKSTRVISGDLILESLIIQLLKENEKEYYWQLVSNSVLSNVERASLFIWVPSREEDLEAIRYEAQNFDRPNMYQRIEITKYNCPYLFSTEYYPALLDFSFEVPKADKEFIERRVKLATQLLDK